MSLRNNSTKREMILVIGLMLILSSMFAYAATSIELTTGNFINVFGNLNLSGNNLVNAGNVSIRGNLSVVGNVSVDGSTLFVDATSNNVGIGTTSPNYLLQTASGTDGRSVNFKKNFFFFLRYRKILLWWKGAAGVSF